MLSLDFIGSSCGNSEVLVAIHTALVFGLDYFCNFSVMQIPFPQQDQLWYSGISLKFQQTHSCFPKVVTTVRKLQLLLTKRWCWIISLFLLYFLTLGNPNQWCPGSKSSPYLLIFGICFWVKARFVPSAYILPSL